MRKIPIICAMANRRGWSMGWLLTLCLAPGIHAVATSAVEHHDLTLSEVVLTVDVNHGKPAEEDALTDGQRVLLPASMLDEFGMLVKPKLEHVNGKDYFDPQSIQGAENELDLNTLAVHIVVPGDLLKGHNVNLSEPVIRTLTPEPPWSGFLSYSYSRTESQGRAYQQALLSPHLRIFGWSIFDDQVLSSTPAGFSNHRFDTVAYHDWPNDALRLLVGDYTPSTGDLGATFSLAGITLQQSYALQPGQVINPTASMSGIAPSPSQAQIYMDGVLIGGMNIGPGPFNFQGLQGYGGLRNISVLVTDAAGNQHAYYVPYYFSNELLKAGFDTFDMSFGSPRASFGAGGYSGKAASIAYLYGVTDWWTVGTNDSYLQGDRRLSPLMTFGLGPVGTITLMSAQRQHDHQRRYAHEVNFDGVWQHTEFRFQWRHAQKDFDDALTLVGNGQENVSAPGVSEPSIGVPILPDLRARDRYSMTVSQTLGLVGTLSANVGRLCRFDNTMVTSESLNWSLRLPWRGQLTLSGLRATGSGTRLRGIFASVYIPLGNRTTVSAGYRNVTNSPPQRYIEATMYPPSDGGFGYWLYDSWQGPINDKDAHVTWLNRWTQIDVGARDVDDGSFVQQSTNFSISGAVATIEGHVYLTPEINDAFAVADVGYPGVGINRGGTPIGVTGRNGTLLVPSLAPYAATTLSVREDDLPMDVDLLEPRIDVVPADGAGVLVKFALPKISAVNGSLHFSPAHGGGAINNYAITVTAPDGEVFSQRTGDAGFFELDNMTSGDYRIDVPRASPACTAVIHVPDERPAIWQAGQVTCE
ncbi:fimbria/pilus outer membrane usher protein [Dyella lipolytica]|uniref:Fimbrial biogenesis outer membrane usher protein n=1 Tax=Dyella lipolytica TaxID=1867835 RepID=A0ABW8IXP7_9GAMM|nr:fimbria/pilus outer membrane usher protein [Dyella lipolytica]